MSETEKKYTPGPWDWQAVGANASGGFHLYLVDTNMRKIGALWGGHDEKVANARLIAAAPDLLEALTALLHAPYKLAALCGGSEYMEASAKARAAIAKAKASNV